MRKKREEKILKAGREEEAGTFPAGSDDNIITTLPLFVFFQRAD